MSNTNRLRLVITGATGGIGRELLRSMHPYIDFVILNGLNLNDLRQTQNDLGLKNGVCIAGDVSNSSVRDQIYQAAELNGGVNLLINNAGMNNFDFFSNQSDEMIENLINVNLTSPMLLTKKLLPLLKKNRSQVINTGSIFGYLGFEFVLN